MIKKGRGQSWQKFKEEIITIKLLVMEILARKKMIGYSDEANPLKFKYQK